MKPKRIITLVVIVAAAVIGILCLGLRHDFDAQGYVQAILNQTFKGETEKLADIVADASEESLYQQYEDGVDSFVTKNLLNNVEADEEVKQKFVELWKDVFKSLKYEVKQAEKISNEEYAVAVEIEPTDIFLQFVASVETEQQNLNTKVEKGEYSGTKEEIESQMQKEVLESRYNTLKAAYENPQYSEKTVVRFRVTSDENHVFSIEEEGITTLVTKLLRLDEIQD